MGNSKYYSNETVLDPDGKILFRGSSKRVNWYLKKGLAILVDFGPPRIVKLLFTPNGTGASKDSFSLAEKHTRCVVCGCENNLTKHHVVPICYRSHMSNNYKNYNMHDVVLLCEKCHTDYEKLATKLKKDFANRYNSPLDGVKTVTSDVVGYCKTILKYSDQLPPEKFKKMIDAIEKEFGNSDSSTINECAKIGYRAFITHGELVISRMQETEQEFVVLWRKHFLETMKPKFLSDGWSVNRNVYINKKE